MDLTLSDLPEVYAYLNEIIVLSSSAEIWSYSLAPYSTTPTKSRLENRDWTQSWEITFHFEENQIFRIINSQGISVDSQAISAIANMPKPTSVLEVFLRYSESLWKVHSSPTPIKAFVGRSHSQKSSLSLKPTSAFEQKRRLCWTLPTRTLWSFENS